MNIAKIIDHFSHKSWTWQRAFCDFYLLKHNLYGLKCKTDIEPAMLARCCRNVDDLQEMWDLAEYLDETEDEMIDIIGNYRYFRPIPWQYDFVEAIEEMSGIPIHQTLNLDALTDAYCIALCSDNINLTEIVNRLDETFGKLYASAAHKQILLKRNFSLTLETLGRHRGSGNAAGLNFRELLEDFLPDCDFKRIVAALKQSDTAETKLTAEERAALGFAYYSPYFFDEVDLKYGKIPGSSIFACVEERLREEREYRAHLQEERWKAHDEDDEDDITDALEETHNAVYVDPQERCLIDTRYGETLYANVYIERTPEDFLNNSLPDFIRYHKGCLYSVEFVDDIKTLDVAQELLERLNSINCEMLQLERKQLATPEGTWTKDEKQKYDELGSERAACYYICD